jgi:thiol-disulfide isomerase/thioredoxin
VALQQDSSTGKKSLYHAAAGQDKQLRELYAVGGCFSTGRGTDRMGEEGKTMRIRTWLVVLVLLAAATAVAAPQAAKTAAVHDPEMIDLQAYQKLVAQYHGKPLLVNFWATWCEPCRHEYPMLNELAKQYAPQGLKVVGVSLDDDGDLILMRRFLARYKPIFPNYRKKAGGIEAFTQAILPGWTGSLPVSVFYRKDGQQAGHMLGEGTREKYEAAIQSLLASGSN